MTIGELARRILGPLTDPVARFYRSYFVDLDDLARELSSLEEVATILEIGCGDGHLCQALAAAFPDAEVLGIDIAEHPGTLYRGRSEGVEFRQVERSWLWKGQASSTWWSYATSSTTFLGVSGKA